jgi:tetratricopeptide (TPR) repeat protein
MVWAYIESMSSQHLERAMLLYELSRYQQAATEFQKALSQDPDDASIHTFLGSCFFYEDQYPEAEAALREGIRLSPDWSESYRILANCCFYQSRAEEGHRLIQTAIQLSPEDPNCFWTLSKLYTLQQNYAAALKAANQGLEINPEHVTCLQAKALVLGSLHQYTEGLDIIKIALNKAPESAENHAIKGYLLYQQNHLQAASDSFKTALSIDPQNGLANAMITHAAKVENQSKEQQHWQKLAIAGAFLAFLMRIATAVHSDSSDSYATYPPGLSTHSTESTQTFNPKVSSGLSLDGRDRSDPLVNWLELQLELLSPDSTCKIPGDAERDQSNHFLDIRSNKGYQNVMISLTTNEIKQLGKAIKLKCKNTPRDLKTSKQELNRLKPKLDKIHSSLYPELLSIYNYLGVPKRPSAASF